MFILFLFVSSQLHVTFASYLNLSSVKNFLDSHSRFVPYSLDFQLLFMSTLRTLTLCHCCCGPIMLQFSPTSSSPICSLSIRLYNYNRLLMQTRQEYIFKNLEADYLTMWFYCKTPILRYTRKKAWNNYFTLFVAITSLEKHREAEENPEKQW